VMLCGLTVSGRGSTRLVLSPESRVENLVEPVLFRCADRKHSNTDTLGLEGGASLLQANAGSRRLSPSDFPAFPSGDRRFNASPDRRSV